MRKLLLASAAVAALLAGPAVANAQSSTGSQQVPDASSQQHAPKAGVDEEKGARPKAAQSGDHRQTTGSSQAAQRDSKPDAPKTGASQMNKETTGSSQGAQHESKSDARKSSASQMNKETTGSQGAQHEGKSNAQKSGAPRVNKETTGSSEGARGTQPKASSSTERNERATIGQSQTDQRMKGDRANRGNQVERNRDSTSMSASVTREEQTKFNEVIEKKNVKPLTNVTFSVSVGSTIPRSVHVYDVPRDIVTAYPEYRGKKFVVVRDQIVIVQPRTYEIVAVVPRSGRTTTGTSTSVRETNSSKLNLSPEKRRMIRETVIKEQAAPRCADLLISVGTEVPRSIDLRTFPATIVREVPEIRSYQFCLKGDEVVLIDPDAYRIVEVIE